ncbi:MAG TPA: SDR family oxidoreductase [Coleofasciculaceae cyanobacterium]|jgi:hypothetical protein
MQKVNELSEQTAIITGAGQGIGLAVAHHLARLGMNLVLCARGAEKLHALSDQIKKQRPETQVMVLPCDVRDHLQVEQVVVDTLERFGRIDVLINNAGVAPKVGLLQEMSIDDIDRTIDTNLKGVIYFMRAVLPAMVHQQQEQPQGSKLPSSTIININSVAGKTAYPFWSVYDASKFGLTAITEAVAEEQRTNNIKVVGIYPGAVDTPIWHGIDPDHEPSHKGMLDAETIAEAVVYILQQPQKVFITDLTLSPLKPVL